MLPKHKNINKHLSELDDREYWIFNTIFHMIDLFDKKKNIVDYKISKKLDCCGRLCKVRRYYNKFDKNTKKRIEFSRIKYLMEIDYKLLENNYEDYKKEGDNVVLYSLEQTLLHEFAHLKNYNHSKNFEKTLRRYMIKWIAYRLNVSQLESKRDYGKAIKKY